MIGSDNKNLKEEILEILLQGSKRSRDIQNILNKKHIKVTIQAIYKQLKILLLSGVVLKNKQTYKISNEWIRTISQKINIQEIELPEEGEKFTYTFNSLQNLDQHWKHTIAFFHNNFKQEPHFLYSHHQFWIYTPTRETSEKEFVYESNNTNYTFYVIGGLTELDKKYRNNFRKKNFKIENFCIKSLKEKEHIFVIKDLIVNVKISEHIAKKIDLIYKKDISIKDKEKELQKLLAGKHRAKFTIENNSKKAKKIKNKILKPFWVPQEIKTKIT